MNSRVTDDLHQKRKKGGAWLKQKREEVGLSQRELADILEINFYNFISQIENGRSRVPIELMKKWALALRIQPRDFAKTMTFYFDPGLYSMLFPDDPENKRDETN